MTSQTHFLPGKIICGSITTTDQSGGGSNAGPQGPQGEKGDRGEKGDKGDRGDVGPQGVPGSSSGGGSPAETDTLYVDSSAPSGGDGSRENPFSRVVDATNAASSINGAQSKKIVQNILLRDGVYSDDFNLEPGVSLRSLSGIRGGVLLDCNITMDTSGSSWTNDYSCSIVGVAVSKTLRAMSPTAQFTTVSLMMRNCDMPVDTSTLRVHSGAKIIAENCNFYSSFDIYTAVEANFHYCNFLSDRNVGIFWKVNSASICDLRFCTFGGAWRFNSVAGDTRGEIYLRGCSFGSSCEITGALTVHADCGPRGGFISDSDGILDVQGTSFTTDKFYSSTGGFVQGSSQKRISISVADGGYCTFEISGAVQNVSGKITMPLPEFGRLKNSTAIIGTAYFTAGNYSSIPLVLNSDRNAVVITTPTASPPADVIITGNYSYCYN